MKYGSFCSVVLLLATTLPASSQTEGTVERVHVMAPSLEGNLSGDPAARYVSVYLPPSYGTDLARRYSVVYMLHGFTDTDAQWMGFRDHWINLPEILDAAIADGSAEEMIVVMPDAFTRFHGSMYSSSVTVGDWEGFVARDLVDYVDTTYRTIPRRESRGLAGHSMGGYGALRIGMKRPDVFSSIYLLSPCCLSPNLMPNPALETVTSPDQIDSQSFFTLAGLASAAAWSPNPDNPPFFIDLPTRDGEVVEGVAQRFYANSPLAMLDQYIFNLRELNGIGMDAGNEDRGIAATTRILHERLDSYGLPHVYEEYEGDHLNRVGSRIHHYMLSFFSTHLESDP